MLKLNKTKQMQNQTFIESATNQPRPGDFPLGSLESRAAARLALTEKAESMTIVQVFYTTDLNAPLPPTPFRVDEGPGGTRVEYYENENS